MGVLTPTEAIKDFEAQVGRIQTWVTLVTPGLITLVANWWTGSSLPVAVVTVFGVLVLSFIALHRWALWKSQLAPTKEKSDARAKAEQLNRRVYMRDALAYWATGSWKWPNESGIASLMALHNAARDFERYAKNGLLTIWGSDNVNMPADDELPPDYWREWHIDRMTVHHDNVQTEHLVAIPVKYRKHFNLLVDPQQVEELREAYQEAAGI